MAKRAKNKSSAVASSSTRRKTPVPQQPAGGTSQWDSVYNESSPVKIVKTKINGRKAIESTTIAQGLHEDRKFVKNHLNREHSGRKFWDRVRGSSKKWDCVEEIKAGGSKSAILYTALVNLLNRFSKKAHGTSLSRLPQL